MFSIASPVLPPPPPEEAEQAESVSRSAFLLGLSLGSVRLSLREPVHCGRRSRDEEDERRKRETGEQAAEVLLGSCRPAEGGSASAIK